MPGEWFTRLLLDTFTGDGTMARILKCPCCTARSDQPQSWCGCEAGISKDVYETDCNLGCCGNKHKHNKYGCGSWSNELQEKLGYDVHDTVLQYLRGGEAWNDLTPEEQEKAEKFKQEHPEYQWSKDGPAYS